MEDSQNVRPVHHIAVASEMLAAIGSAERIMKRTSHGSTDQALALAAMAHIQMADFKANNDVKFWRSDVDHGA